VLLWRDHGHVEQHSDVWRMPETSRRSASGVFLPAVQLGPPSAVQPEAAEANDSSGRRRPVEIREMVRVGPLKPDGVSPHPHAGTVGRVMDIFNGHAHVVVTGGNYGICVSVSCLEVA
jgi:hypothetical protein